MSAVGNPPSDGSPSPTVIQWVLDTRTLWPEAEKTGDLPRVVSQTVVQRGHSPYVGMPF